MNPLTATENTAIEKKKPVILLQEKKGCAFSFVFLSINIFYILEKVYKIIYNFLTKPSFFPAGHLKCLSRIYLFKNLIRKI